jgi:hypothetical protein
VSSSNEISIKLSNEWEERTHLIIGFVANSHHISWGSTNVNSRGESLFIYIMANGLDVMNKGNRPTFVTCNRQEVGDITIATLYAGNFIKKLARI